MSGSPSAEPSEVFVIDTSSIIQARRLPTELAKRAFRELSELAKSGALFFPPEVLKELDRWKAKREKDLPLEWAKQNSAACRRKVPIERVAEVLRIVPDVLDPERQVEEADPYVLALALEWQAKGKKVVVVTEERKDRPDKLSMNTACGLLRMPCLPVQALLREVLGLPPA